MTTAKLFWSGRSQALRLPKEFRMNASEVRLRRQGANIVIEPLAADWAWLASLEGRLDSDFQEAVHDQPVADPNSPSASLFD